MQSSGGHNQFASDNTAGICPEVLAALEEANHAAAESYGADQWTSRVRELVRNLFETDCDVYLVFNGTAANALALAQLCQPFHSVVCHDHAHIQTDECGAPEFFTRGSKLLLVGGDAGKIDINEVETVIARQPEVHAHQPRVISITQATEFGTVYTRDEIGAIDRRTRAEARNVSAYVRGTIRECDCLARLLGERNDLEDRSGCSLLWRDKEWGGRGRTRDIFQKRAFSRIRLSLEASRPARIQDAFFSSAVAGPFGE